MMTTVWLRVKCGKAICTLKTVRQQLIMMMTTTTMMALGKREGLCASCR